MQLSLVDIERLGQSLCQRIGERAEMARTNRPWTQAVYDSLKELALQRNWRLYPEAVPYKGEYLCDFMLMQDGYGCRIASESQWQNQGNTTHQADLDWAFDKLRGVKSDIKLFICEGAHEQLTTTLNRYLSGYAQLSSREVFLVLRWQKDHFTKYRWVPPHDGLQSTPIQFEIFE